MLPRRQPRQYAGVRQEGRSRVERYGPVVAFAASFSMAFASVTADAGQAVSSYGYYSNNGVDYKNWAAAITDPPNSHQAYAVTMVSPTNKAVASGWAGAMPRIYKNGALVCEDGYTYNSGSLAKDAVLSPSGCFYYTSGTWSTQGATRSWNGNSYDSYWTFSSPSQSS